MRRTRVHDTLGVAVTHVVANASSTRGPMPHGRSPPATVHPRARSAWETEKSTRFFAWRVRRVGVRELQPPGRRTREPVSYTGRQRRAVETALVPVRPRFRQADTLPLGGFDSSRPAMAQGDAPRQRRSVREVRERESWREAPNPDRARVRPQRSVRVYDGRRAAGHLSARAVTHL